MNTFQAIKITEEVYWVGAIDWSIRDFHGYSTHRGTTYNAFLVLADKITLIDTVKSEFRDEMMTRIASVIDPQQIDLVVSNHSELDHSGCLPYVVHLVQPEKIFASNMGEKTLNEHLSLKHEITVVKNGESVSLGNKTLTFYETRMLHWPDSMFSYLVEDKILFSQDAFGMHLATAERFDDELDFTILKREAAKYFANILLPYTLVVYKLLKKLEEENVSPSMILPDHGPIWRSDVTTILDLYHEWAQQKSSDKAVVVYDTMWNSTAKMAAAIADGLLAGGAKAELFPMSASQRADIATEVMTAGALIVGSPTLNNNMYPTIADILIYLRGLRRTGMIGAAFGSYGWGGEALKQIEEALAEMKVEIVSESVKAKYVPTADNLQNCFDLGLYIAKELRTRTNM